MKQYRLGVLGAGNMGMAIAQGAVRAGLFAASDILLFNRSEEKQQAHADAGFAVTGDYPAVYTGCDWMIFGVKPQNFDEILPRLAQEKVDPKPLIISIAAGVPMKRIEKALGEDIAIIRVMPNTPLMLGCGATALVGNRHASTAQIGEVRALFDSMGVTAVFDREDALNDVIPYNGSGPAYVYAFIDAMVKSAVAHNIPSDDALRLICQMCIGSAQMMLQSGLTPETLIQQVCSPGGTTIEAIKVLESRDFAGILAEASDKCIDRAYALGRGDT